MKKRILSILLILCMVLSIAPATVFAEDSGSTAPAERNGIVLGSSGIQTDDMVYFGEYTENGVSYHVPWRALDTNGFFLSRYTLGSSLYYNPGESCYNDSVLRRVMDGFYNGDTTLFTNAERNAIKETLLSGESIRKNEYLGEVGQDMNAYVFPLSLADVLGIGDGSPRLVAPAITDPDVEGRQWWTRTINRGTIYVNTDGEIYRTSFPDSSNYDVLPAFNMELSSVLFTSAAVGGKADTATDENLTAVSDYVGSEWKLTLKDSSRSISANVNGQTSASVPAGGSVQITYSGAQTGENEYVSLLLCDSNDNVLYYGNIAQSSASGTASVTIPANLAVGDYTLKVFSEQCNGDKKTDYASDFVNIDLTVTPDEQFSLTPGGTYYFDLSGENIPGTANSGNSYGATSLPDTSLHYVPFTYAGTVNAYKLTSAMATTEEYAQQNKYAHSLFVADYAVTHTVSWNDLNTKSLIFGQDYASSGVDYTLRAPSVGSDYTGWGDSERGTPQSNEWDAILNKNSEYILNWSKMYSWGQDGNSRVPAHSTYRGYYSARYLDYPAPTFRNAKIGFRPVLEVLNADALDSDGLKAVTLDLNSGTLGGSSGEIQIIVKKGSTFTAPVSDGLTRPDGDTGNFFMWLGSNGKLYDPGDCVPADVTALTVQWSVPTYTVTLNANGGTINSGNVTGYTYGAGATLPTDVTRTGYTFDGWYDNAAFSGAAVTSISNTDSGNKTYYAKWTEKSNYIVIFISNGGTLANDKKTVKWTDKVLDGVAAPTRNGYDFADWKCGGTRVTANTTYASLAVNDTVTSVTLTAQWLDIAAPTGEIKIAENGWKSFFNNITFGLFFKDTQTVTVTATDNSGEDVTIEYLLSDRALTQAELAGMTFTTYSAPFNINPDNEYVIYAKLTDTSGNVAYINTDGIVLDATVPVISGIENGKTYCAAQTVTVTEKYIGTVTVNGNAVALDSNHQFTLNPAEGEQTIVVTDKAGNETRVTVTVNDGHTYEWQSENGQYWQKCKFCGDETAKKDIPTINISGSDKVCWTQDYKFSFTLPEGATDAAYGYEFIGLGDGPLTPTVENGLYSGIIKASTYPAKENSFKLIVSAKTADGFDFSAEKTVTIQNAHSGGTATCTNKAVCEICGESYGELNANNHSDLKHFPAVAATKTAEGNIEYWYCEGCGKYYKDAKATQEITKAQTVTAKLPDDSKSPQTGDNSNLALWIALLFISGGAVTVTTVYGRKKKRLTK